MLNQKSNSVSLHPFRINQTLPRGRFVFVLDRGEIITLQGATVGVQSVGPGLVHLIAPVVGEGFSDMHDGTRVRDERAEEARGQPRSGVIRETRCTNPLADSTQSLWTMR